jgi:hypothetical protein
MRAYVYGSEVTIIDFYVAKHGTPYCRVRYKDSNWTSNVPQLCVEIRK